MKALVMVSLVLIGGAACKSNQSSIPSGGNSPAVPAPASASPASAVAANAPAIKSRVDACSLLSSNDLKSVQGEAYKEAQRSDREDNGLVVAQCYYQMPTMANSVVLNVTTAADRTGARNPRDAWQQTFHGEKDRETGKSRAREQEKKNAAGRDGEAEEEFRPERVKGLGDEAFWSATRVGGALYVLKKDQYFRVSVGGAGAVQNKLHRSKTLARVVLQKLQG